MHKLTDVCERYKILSEKLHRQTSNANVQTDNTADVCQS